MDKNQKKEIAEEVLKNMSITKEEYIEFCKLCDELDLVPETNWDDALKSF